MPDDNLFSVIAKLVYFIIIITICLASYGRFHNNRMADAQPSKPPLYYYHTLPDNKCSVIAKLVGFSRVK
jgi:hypothetical protein